MKIGAYTKFIVAAVLAVATTFQAAISDSILTNTEIVGVGLALLTALGVYALPNSTPTRTTTTKK